LAVVVMSLCYLISPTDPVTPMWKDSPATELGPILVGELELGDLACAEVPELRAARERPAWRDSGV
jgi:hypothetical protein